MVVKSTREISTPKEIQDGGGIYKKGVCEPGAREQCIDEERADRYIPPVTNLLEKPMTVATTGDNTCLAGESNCHVQDVSKSMPRWLDKGMTTAATFAVKVRAALNPLSLGGCAPHKNADIEEPRQYQGDGVYTLKPGDEIVTNNGIRITVRFQKRSDNPEWPLYTHQFVLDAYVGDDSIPVTGIPHAIIVNGEGRSSEPVCMDLYKVVRIGYQGSNIVGDVPTITLEIGSLTEEVMTSRQQVAGACIDQGERIEVCKQIVPWEPFENERLFTSGRYTVLIPEGVDTNLAYQRLSELQTCHNLLTEWSGIDTPYDKIGLRYLDGARPHALRGITADDNIPFSVICHEVFHVMLSGISTRLWIEEGLAVYVEQDLASTLPPQEDTWYIMGQNWLYPGEQVPVTTGSDVTYTLESIDDAGSFVEVSVDDPPEDHLRVPVPGMFRASDSLYVLAREVTDGQVNFVVYGHEDQGNYRGMAIVPVCKEDGVFGYGGVHVNGIVPYPVAYSVLPPEWVPYEDIYEGKGLTTIYAGGACFWRMFKKEFGEQSIINVVREMDRIRRVNAEGGSEPYCYVPILEGAAGGDIGSFLRRFGFPDGEKLCLPPIEAMEFYQLEGPMYEGCEIGALRQ